MSDHEGDAKDPAQQKALKALLLDEVEAMRRQIAAEILSLPKTGSCPRRP